MYEISVDKKIILTLEDKTQYWCCVRGWSLAWVTVSELLMRYTCLCFLKCLFDGLIDIKIHRQHGCFAKVKLHVSIVRKVSVIGLARWL